MLDVELP